VRVVQLNAAHYGSAQARERVVFLCRRDKDFLAINPGEIDGSKRFRDFRDLTGPFRSLSDKSLARMKRKDGDGFLPVGGWDRINTLTTGISSSGRDSLVIREKDGELRYMTALEGERLQGFPEGWTQGESLANRWYAIGNAVNCAVSRYLFTDYLKKLWWTK
jgi:site-specific DNA-cytosine methylase